MRNRTAVIIAGAALITVGSASATAPGLNGAIAFRRFPPDGSLAGVTLFLINPDGTGERQLTHPPADAGDEGPPSFSADGSQLVFTRDESKTQSIWRVNADGTGEQRLTPAPRFAHPVGRQRNQVNRAAAYSPNGRLIAFARDNPPARPFPGGGGLGGRQSLEVMAPDGTNTRRVVDLGYRYGIGSVTWSPNGKQIAYAAARLGGQSANAVFVVGAHGGRPKRISAWRRDTIDVDWSPNGKLLLLWFLPPGGENGGDYYTMRPDGSRLHRLTHFGAKALTGFARWSPDGKSIVFANGGVGGADDIYVMHANGTGITPVTRTPAWDSGPAWGPAR